MRIGLYGMPTAGKTYIMDKLDFVDVLVGSKILRDYDPEFDSRDEAGREKDRKDVANMLLTKKEFVMDGHYAFGDEIAFTEEEGNMYDVYMYLYIDPDQLKQRMESSEKNRKYLRYDIAKWQKTEIDGLREYCHRNAKDFYVVDNPPRNQFADAAETIEFLKSLLAGFSCVGYARECATQILETQKTGTVILADGDKTLTREDSGNVVFGYTTQIFDGNFYTGYQFWRQEKELAALKLPDEAEIPVHFNQRVLDMMGADSYILTSGHQGIWSRLADKLGMECFSGQQMAAETKYFIVKYLQQSGMKVITIGDGMNDYFMLKAADEGYLVTKEGGRVSRSLVGRDLEGISLV